MNRRKNLEVVVWVWVFLAVLAGPAAGGRTIYVDPNGSADFNSIQAAIDDANDGNEIEVAPAIYLEAINFSGKAIRLYSAGGPEVTIINANGIAGAYHVVQCVSSEGPNTILEGFTITGGNANGPDPNDRYGGGMYCENSSPTVTDCTFSGNSAGIGGGGMCNNLGSSPTVTDCTFSGNSAGSDGGGMYCKNSSPTVTNCTFSGNSADSRGGGMFNYYSSPTMTDCTFSGNTANYGGGGMYCDHSIPTVTNCTFSGNSAEDDGGGMCNVWNSSATVTNCTFSGNSAGLSGGGMLNETGSAAVTNCTFSGNSASHGGGMLNAGASATVTNCTFSGNSADSGGGGGMYNNDGGATVTNCTFSGNSAAWGGGMYTSGSPTVTNCILWDDTPDEIYDFSSDLNVTYSNIQGGYGGIGNIGADPLFERKPNDGGDGWGDDPCTVDVDEGANDDFGDLRLQACSMCVDAGNNAAVPPEVLTDLAGNPRFVDDANVADTGAGTARIVDMGAYERQLSSATWRVYNVTRDVRYCTIQMAIDDGDNGDEIVVLPGTYYEAIDFTGKAIRLYSAGGPEVTIINANGIAGAYHVVQCVSSEGPNTILEGFTITGGDANGPDPNDRYGGGMYCENSNARITNCTFSGNTANYAGGMYCSNSSPTVTNCTFSGNSAASDAGGMRNDYASSPTVTNCTFTGNSAEVGGGGMCNKENSNPTVTNCTFTGNSASTRGSGMLNSDNSSPTVINCIFTGNFGGAGGGMYNYTSSPTVTNCMFSGNTAFYNGGGMYNRGSNPTVTNCTFTGNSAPSWGGGMDNYTSSPTVTNCTFSGNTASLYGGGMHNRNNSSPTVTNCILWDDTPDEIDDVDSTPTVTYSDVQGSYPGIGNISADPLFERKPNDGGDGWGDDPCTVDVDEGANDDFGDLRLQACSPCIDAGDSNSVPPDTADLDGDGNTVEPIPLDLAGNERFVDDEGRGDTGAGTPPIVDMGAYERQSSSPTWRVRNVTTYVGYCTIQMAIDDANDGDKIEVAPGTYNETIDFMGKAVHLYSSGGPWVTIIDANWRDGAYHVVQCMNGEDASTILEGFTIARGKADNIDEYELRGAFGGGMFCLNSSPTVINCIFTGNLGKMGGGMFCENSSPTLTNCIFAENLGTGMSNADSNPIVTNCTFFENTESGLYNYAGSPTVTNCIFWGHAVEIFNPPIVTYSNVKGGRGQSWFGIGCIDADPRFVDVGKADFSLLSVSPCVNAGDNNSLPADTTDLDDDGDTAEPIPFDLVGNARVASGADVEGIVDMGAYELQARVHNIRQSAWYVTIQAAIDDANDGDDIAVEPGRYSEAIDLDGRAIRLRSTDANDPNVVAITIIDANGLGSSVITCATNEGPNTILAGFTITGGQATYGGGMYCENSSPTVSNCDFIYNTADCNGGGMYNLQSSPVVTGCLFCGNSTGDGQDYKYPRSEPHGDHGGHAGHGAGMYNDHSSAIVSYCDFIENRTGAGGKGQNGSDGDVFENGGWGGDGGDGGYGAGMYNYFSDPNISNCRFRLNETGGGGNGGAGGQAGWSIPELDFGNNGGNGGRGGIAGNGAAMYNDSSNPVVTNCEFVENQTGSGGHGNDGGNACGVFIILDWDNLDNGGDGGDGGYGGYGAGMYNSGSGTTVTNCTFKVNFTGNGGNGGNAGTTELLGSDGGDGGYGGYGAGMYNFASNLVMTNCTLTGNVTADGGSGGEGTYGCLIAIFFGEDGKNGIRGLGGGMSNDSSSLTVTNCILWGDTPDEMYDVNSTPTVTYSDIYQYYPGTGNIWYYPFFVNKLNGDLRLMPCSPCVDAGNNDAVPQGVLTDLDGNPRFVDDEGAVDTGAGTPPIVDMGAYELQLDTLTWPVHNVTKDTLFCTIELAVDAADNGDEIEVLPGVYNEVIDFDGKSVILRSTNPNDPSVVAATVINAERLSSSAVTCDSNEGPDTVLAGFTITGGHARLGGGMYCYSSSPTVSNCVFADNSAINSGGGMGVYQGNPTVTNCTFSGNGANFGGGMWNFFNSSPTVTNCTFSGNSAVYDGGGMYNSYNSSPTVTNCTLCGNSAASDAGGMRNDYASSPTVTNCTFSGNIAGDNGGGMVNYIDSSPTLTNCTFGGNSAGEGGGGILNLVECNPIITNCIIWGDAPDAIYDAEYSVPVVSYSDVQGGYPGIGNIDADPNFVYVYNPDPNLCDLRLLPASPCIDAGDNDSVPADTADLEGDGDTVEPIPFDLGGLPRFVDDLCTGDTGNGAPPVVDMGAYEYLPADIDGSGVVDLRDLCEFALQWAETGCGRCSGANMTCEGDVDWNDLRELCAWWLAGK